MLERCRNPKAKKFAIYGGSGVTSSKVQLTTTDGDLPRLVAQIHMAQGKDPSSMTISWVTPLVTAPTTCCGDVPIIASSEVYYGLSPDGMKTREIGYSQYYTFNWPGMANYTSGLIHHVVLTGLKPGS